MKLVHFSKIPGLTSVSPEYAGSGVRGQEYKRGIPEVKRSYFYVLDTPYERLVTNNTTQKYFAELSPDQRIYDLGVDPDGHVKQSIQANGGAANSDDFLGRIKNAGYYGFTNSNSSLPNVVALFHEHPVYTEQITPKIEEGNTMDPLSHHAILSTENPAYPDKASQQLSVDDAVKLLQQSGENAITVKGQYGSPENSILVHQPKDMRAIVSLARKTGQESIIISDGKKHKMLFVNGPDVDKYLPGEGTTYYEPGKNPEDFYTEVPGQGSFTHNFDWDAEKRPHNYDFDYRPGPDPTYNALVNNTADNLLRPR